MHLSVMVSSLTPMMKLSTFRSQRRSLAAVVAAAVVAAAVVVAAVVAAAAVALPPAPLVPTFPAFFSAPGAN